MSKIGTSCAIFKDILGMHLEEDKALAIHDVMEMPTHNGFTKVEMLNVIKWLWHQKYRLDDEPMTNADRIRNMTDEELAELLKEAEDCGYRDASITPIIKGQGYMDMLVWLQSEVKEGESNGGSN